MKPIRSKVENQNPTFLGKKFNIETQPRQPLQRVNVNYTFKLQPDPDAPTIKQEKTDPQEIQKDQIDSLASENNKLYSLLQELTAIYDQKLEHIQFLDSLRCDDILDYFREYEAQILIYQNRLSTEMYKNEKIPLPPLKIEHQHIDKSSILQEIQNLKNTYEQELFLIETLSDERQKAAHDLDLCEAEIKILQQEITQINQLTHDDMQRFEEKNLLIHVLYDQFHTIRKFTKGYLVQVQKTNEFDSFNYERYAQRTKNQKTLMFEPTSKLKIDDNLTNPWWSASKKQNKAISSMKNLNSYKFDKIFSKENNQAYLQQLNHEIVHSLRSILYPNIEAMHKQYSFNSQEFQMLYNDKSKEVSNHQYLIELAKGCLIYIPIQAGEGIRHDDETAQQNTVLERFPQQLFSIIQNLKELLFFIISEKDRGLIKDILCTIQQALYGFHNPFVVVRVMSYQIESFQVREIPKWSHQDVNFSTSDFKQFLEEAETMRYQLYERFQCEFKVTCEIFNPLLNLSFIRSISVIAFSPFLIENTEIFARQFKSGVKKEKGQRDHLGSKLEQILRQSDKQIIFLEAPHWIKLNQKENIKITKVKANLDFYQNLMIRRKQN